MVTYMTLYIKLDLHRPNGYVAMTIAVQARNAWKVRCLNCGSCSEIMLRATAPV